MTKKSRKEWKALAQLRASFNMVLSEENDEQAERIDDLTEVIEMLTILSNDVLDENENLTSLVEVLNDSIDDVLEEMGTLTSQYQNLSGVLEAWKNRALAAEDDLRSNDNVYRISSKPLLHGWSGGPISITNVSPC